MLNVKKTLTKILQRIDNLKNMETRTLLWTNPSPNSSFTAKDVALSGAYNTYEYLEVEYKSINTENTDYGAKILERTSCHAGTVVSVVAYNNAWYLRHRARWWNSAATGMHFDSAFYNNLVTPSSNGQNDAVLVPYRIWGIKKLGGVVNKLFSVLINVRGWSCA